jgi:Protein of unknown function (DUF3489)
MAKTQTKPPTQSKSKAPAKAAGVATIKAAPKAGAKRMSRATAPAAPATPPASSAPAGKTKLQIVVDLLERPQGARIDELMEATGWQAHSVRGALAGALKKKGIEVTSAKVEGSRCYSVAKAGRA